MHQFLESDEPAFPLQPGELEEYYPGMSMREWYAGMALAGLSSQYQPTVAARRAFELADAMLEEAARPPQETNRTTGE